MGTCFTSRNAEVQQKSPASTAIEYLMLTFNTHTHTHTHIHIGCGKLHLNCVRTKRNLYFKSHYGVYLSSLAALFLFRKLSPFLIIASYSRVSKRARPQKKIACLSCIPFICLSVKQISTLFAPSKRSVSMQTPYLSGSFVSRTLRALYLLLLKLQIKNTNSLLVVREHLHCVLPPPLPFSPPPE